MNATTKIIDLGELRAGDAFPSHVAIHATGVTNPYALSPEVMRWSETIYLVRVDSCGRFWQAQKKKLRCTLGELFDPILRYHFGDDHVAVFGNHPWQCLLYLNYQLRHQGKGIHLLQSRLGQNLYRTLDWECWFATQQGLAAQLCKLGVKGFNPDNFTARQAQFRRFIERVGIAAPRAMSGADANAITRRFGAWLGRIWRWSFNGEECSDRFPWVRLAPSALPRVRRELEYPVNDWSFVEALLREDFARLCEQFRRDDCEHVNRMLWEISLFNDQTVTVDLSFRHPYSLHRDMPEFTTALYQARYVYDDLVARLQARDTDLDLPENMPLVAWRVEVCERISLAPELRDLFAAVSEQIDYAQIMALQNKLPIAFESYRPCACFYPEQSFRSAPIGSSEPESFDNLQWCQSAAAKPLFYYPEAVRFEPTGPMQRVFLERNSQPWWLGEDALQSIRDYFLLRDPRGRASWVFRDSEGAWFKHGEYC